MAYFDNFAPSSLAPMGAAPDPRIIEAQKLLAQLGYDPGGADGIWGPKTQSALTALWMAVGRSEAPPTTISDGLLSDLRALVQRQSLNTPQQSLVETTKPPFWKAPLFIGLATVVGSVSLYLLFRESSASVAGADEPEEKEVEATEKPKRKKKEKVEARTVTTTNEWGEKVVVGGHGDVGGAPSLVEKCPRPTVPENFDEGAPLVAEETNSAPAT